MKERRREKNKKEAEKWNGKMDLHKSSALDPSYDLNRRLSKHVPFFSGNKAGSTYSLGSFTVNIGDTLLLP